MDNGRKVKRIWLNRAGGDEPKAPKDGQRMVTLNEFHGEYDLDWICIIDESGNELERHNVKFIASIEWA